MLRIGLTGGIGSGKSTAAKIFEELGVPIIDADRIAKQLCCKNSSASKSIVNHFGPACLQKNGALNRAYISSVIFAQPSQRTWLNHFLHPLIAEKAQLLLQDESLYTPTSPYVILSAPLLFEANWQTMLDRVCVVDLPEILQRERLLATRDLSVHSISRIMACQLSRAQRIQLADDVLDNHADPTQLRQQVIQLDQKYRQLALSASA